MRFFLLCIFINFSLLSHFFSQAVSLTVTEEGSEKSLTNKPAEEATLPEDLLDKARKSVWKIGNSVFYKPGTAFAIGPNLFVTNFHVIAEALQNNNSVKNFILTQETSSSQLTIKRITRMSALHDLVLFETEENVANYLNRAESLPQTDDELFIFGYPQGKFQELRKTGKLIDDAYRYIFPVNHSYLGGISGSPVLDEQGQVVGIASEASVNMLRMIKSNDLKSLIAEDIGLSCSDFSDLILCIKEEVENVKKLADQDDILAQYRLAYMYFDGKILEKNLDLARTWAERSAFQNYSQAQSFLAEMYREEAKEKEPYLAFFLKKESAALAFYWTKESASQNHALAEYNLAMYYEGKDEIIEKDPDLSFFWMQKSASQGFASAQHILAIMVKEDLNLSFFWMQESASQGFAPAQFDLARMHYNGEGTDKNINLAFYWFKQSAEWNYPPSEKALMAMYLKDEVEEQDFELIFNLAKKYADKGGRDKAIARMILEEMYEKMAEEE